MSGNIRDVYLHAPGVDHINAMLQGNADDVVLGEVGGHRGHTFSDLISFIGLLKSQVVGRFIFRMSSDLCTFWRWAESRSSNDQIATVCMASS